MSSSVREHPLIGKPPTGRLAWTRFLRCGPLLILAAMLVAVGGGAHAQREYLPLISRPGPPIPGVDTAGRVQYRGWQAVANRVIVGLRPGQRPEAAQSVAWRMSGRVLRSWPRFGMAVIELPAGVDSAQAQLAAAAAPEVEFAEQDWLVYPAVVPTDPRYSDQWHHPLIHSPEAWDVSTGSAATVIGVIDSGVDLDHPDLASKIYTNPGEIPNNGIDDDGNGFIDDVHGWDFYDNNNDPSPSPDGVDNDNNGEADDEVTHGTLVSGLAAAAANDFGTVGVSWQAQVLPIQVFPDDGGTGVDTVIAGVDYAVEMGVDVINLSLGVPAFVASFTRPMQTCYENGITVVAAAGNGGTPFTANSSTWFSPACNDGPNLGVDNFVIGVAATDQGDRRASFSNYDNSGYRFVDVSAPGLAVFGPGYQNDAFPAFRAYFARGNGTSFSSPIVAGLAALVKGHEPGLTNAQIIERIRQTADNIDSLNPAFAGKLGTGRVNAARALGVDLPPAPVLALQAADTPGDQGGSITVRWLRSTDDGGGANDVTGYVVRRSAKASGPFSLLGSVPAGTRTYVDGGLDNHVDFYYRVTTRDAAGKTSLSEVAGPAFARDDSPPAVVAGVAAVDEAGDDGGAIRVTWSPYSAPSDFAAFRIYRARFSFVTVQGMTPIGTLTDPGATSYLDEATTDGLDYWYAVTAVDAEPNELADVTAAGPVQSYRNQGLAIAPGLHFMATPILPANRDPAAFLGVPPQELQYVRYDPTAMGGQGQYIYYQMAPTSPLMLLGLGRGFWLNTTESITLNPAGAIAPAGSFGISLEPGWRQIGNPFLAQIDFTAATVQDGSVTMDLASAEAAGLMRRYAWVYDETARDYELIDRVIGGGQRLVAPWEGMWVHVLKVCRLVLDRQTGTAAMEAPSSQTSKPLWNVQIVVRAGGRVDSANYVGVAAQPERLDVEAPPPLGGGVTLDLQKGGAGAYAAVFRKPSAGALEWTFTVRTEALGDVTIVTPDLSPIPSEYGVVLTDLDSGRRAQLRTVSSYRYTAEAAGERHFRLTVRRDTATLAVTGLSATPTRQGGVELRFALTGDASCDVEVLNIAGRLVRRLAAAKDLVAGQQVILWNGRNENGVPAPNGTYLLQVRARSAAGSAVSALSRTTIYR